MKSQIELARGLVIGKLVLCFPLGNTPHGTRLWICKCDCGKFVKRDAGTIRVAIQNKHESSCKECQREQTRIRSHATLKKIREYKENAPMLKEHYRQMWGKYACLYTSNFEYREIHILMRELTEEFGPVREWELEDKNFSLDSIYEDEARKPMIVRYCDICGTKLGDGTSERNYASPQIKVMCFPATKERQHVVTLKVELHVTPVNGLNCKEVCSACVAKVVQDGKEAVK
jgi:hypothetical protein